MLSALLPGLLIMTLRTLDVSLGTVRTLLIVEHRRSAAAAIGFVEALVFVVAAGIVFSDLTNPIKIAGYASGFALGTSVGIFVGRAINVGTVTVRIVVAGGPIGVADALRAAGFTVSTFDGEGRSGPIRLLVSTIRKRDLKRLLGVAQPFLDRCFLTIADEEPLQTAFPRADALRK